MRRGLVLLPVLLCSATSASAQAPPRPELPARLEQLLLVNGVSSTSTGPSASVDDVIARMLSFDSDNDGRVTKNELPERMHGILPRGDTDRDEALDLTEIRMLSRQPVELTVRGFPQLHGGGYGFADEGSLSSLSHIQGALEDLRLASATRDKALPLVTAFGQALDADAAEELLTAMQPLLTEEQLADFKQALDPRSPKRFIVNMGQREGTTTRVFMAGPSLARRIATYRLTATQSEQALAAIERYKERLRPGDQDRVALLDQMTGILSDEERDDFRAALERRPIVKSGPGGVVMGVAGRAIAVPPRVTIDVDAPRVRTAILIERVGP
jgi:hypothetical protein